MTVLRSYEGKQGRNHADMATALNNPARLWRKYSSAVVDTALAEYDFAVLSTTLQGKYAEAEPLFERCQAIQEKVLGPEHPDLAVTLGNRALLLACQVRVKYTFLGLSRVKSVDAVVLNNRRGCWRVG